jgi:ribosomal protein S21
MGVDRKQTLRLIKELLKGGTPDWYRFPQDYKAKVDEWHKEARENLLAECREYRFQDQDFLASPRRTNMLTAAAFMRKLRAGGVKCFSHDSTLGDSSASLFALKGQEFIPVCSIQVPQMWEWTCIRLDPKTQLPSGFRDIGWRSAVKCLITEGVLTERRAHEIFGKPAEGAVSRIYRRQLWDFRNQRSKQKNAA